MYDLILLDQPVTERLDPLRDLVEGDRHAATVPLLDLLAAAPSQAPEHGNAFFGAIFSESFGNLCANFWNYEQYFNYI